MTAARDGLEISVLGPLRVRSDGRLVELPQGRARAVVAALALDVGRVVPFDTLVARVWGEEAPEKPKVSVHALVSRLRTALRAADGGPAPLVTEGCGYRLAVPPTAVDATRFEQLVEEAGLHRLAGRTLRARELAGAAVELWRDTAYVDVEAAFADAEADRLAGVRDRAELLAVSLDLELGRAAAVLPRLERLAVGDPLCEPLQAALMLALYRTGRQADAIRRFHAVRAGLADELGVDPGVELRELHRRILRQDPALLPAAPPRAATPARRAALDQAVGNRLQCLAGLALGADSVGHRPRQPGRRLAADR